MEPALTSKASRRAPTVKFASPPAPVIGIVIRINFHQELTNVSVNAYLPGKLFAFTYGVYLYLFTRAYEGEDDFVKVQKQNFRSPHTSFS